MMRSLWWFEENQIAGMGRPGFNCTHFFDYPYEEAVLMGWIGMFPSGKASRKDFEERMKSYCPKVAPFYGLGEKENQIIMDKYKSTDGILDGFAKVKKRTKLLKEFGVSDTHMQFEYCQNRLDEEVSYLKELGIKTIVTLTEEHHNADKLSEHFKAHHFSTNDLDAPSMEHIEQMAELLDQSKKDNEPMVVHCLAGIGRTSTMLIAGHLLLGHKLSDLMKIINTNNPTYTLTGRQKEIIESVQRRMESSNLS